MAQAQNLRVVDALLSGLAQGFQNSETIFEHLFPVVEAEKESGKIPKFGKEHFLLNKTERAMRAKSNRLSWEMGDPISYTMTEHDLDFPYDEREAAEAGTTVDLNRYGTMVTTEAIRLRLEKTAADIAQNLSNYPTGNKVTLTSGSKWTPADAATVDPILDIDTGKAAIRNKVAKHPNVIVFGYNAWRLFKNHPKVIARLSYNGSFPGIITEQMAATLLEVDKVVVGKAIYVTDAGVTADVWADNVILAYVPDTPAENRSVYEPAYGYSVRKTGHPEVDQRPDPDGKVWLIRSTDIITQVLCGADAGYIINDVE